MNQHPWVLTGNQLTLFCYIQPGAKQNQLTGLHDQQLKIQLKAPPVEGQANKMLIECLSDICSIAKSKISIQKGLNSRRKTIIIQGIDQIPEKIEKLITQ